MGCKAAKTNGNAQLEVVHLRSLCILPGPAPDSNGTQEILESKRKVRIMPPVNQPSEKMALLTDEDINSKNILKKGKEKTRSVIHDRTIGSQKRESLKDKPVPDLPIATTNTNKATSLQQLNIPISRSSLRGGTTANLRVPISKLEYPVKVKVDCATCGNLQRPAVSLNDRDAQVRNLPRLSSDYGDSRRKIPVGGHHKTYSCLSNDQLLDFKNKLSVKKADSHKVRGGHVKMTNILENVKLKLQSEHWNSSRKDPQEPDNLQSIDQRTINCDSFFDSQAEEAVEDEEKPRSLRLEVIRINLG